MKSLAFLYLMLFSSLGFSLRAFPVIACDDDVTVYAHAAPTSGLKVIIEFVQDDGTFIQEEGTLSVRSDKSLVANSKSIVVYGNRQGTGYFIQAPARDPYPGHCQSAKF